MGNERIGIEQPVVLAPMTGVTDMPFRTLVRRYGSGLNVTEMIASQAAIRVVPSGAARIAAFLEHPNSPPVYDAGEDHEGTRFLTLKLVEGRSLHEVLSTPGYDPASLTGLAAGGSNIIVFTTGRGSVFGCKPAPCIKVATNTPLYDHMIGDMDIDAEPDPTPKWSIPVCG